MSRVLNAIGSTPWAITDDWLQTIVEIASRENTPLEVVERELGERLESTRTVRVRDGVAVIPVNGPLFRFANLFMRFSGGTSYEELALDFSAALEDDQVRAIVLEIDSPGGQVTGCQEISELIYEARGTKPVVAFATGMAASGAYWIASAADRIVAGNTALLGSIGVVFSYLDTSKRDEKAGVREVEIVSSQSPKKRPDPAAQDGRSQIQVWADEMAQVFVETVARNRGVSVEAALEGFGQGDMMVGQTAVDAGLADEIGTLEELILELQDSAPAGAGGFTRMAQENATMAEQNNGAPAAEQPVIDQAYLEANHADLVTEIEEGAAEKATTAERTRIQAIHDLPAAGHEDLVAKAVDEGWSSGRAAEAILAAQGEKAQAQRDAQLAALKQDEEDLDEPAAGSAGTELEPASVEGQAARLTASSRRISRKRQASD